VGDRVELVQRDEQYIIVDVLPRKNFIARYDHHKGKYQGFAANVDVMFVVTSANREFSPNRIRRFLALCGNQDVKKMIVLTKVDLAKNTVKDFIQTIEKQFAGVGYVAINALCPEQVQLLLKHVKRGQSMLLLGSSGVGKSTIINTLCGMNLAVNEVKGGKHFNKGRHTTSSRNMYYTPCGRRIIDVPGVRIVGVESEVAKSSEIFDKIMDIATGCKFRNCAHETEPGCAVKGAIDGGKLSAEELEWYKSTINQSDR